MHRGHARESDAWLRAHGFGDAGEVFLRNDAEPADQPLIDGGGDLIGHEAFHVIGIAGRPSRWDAPARANQRRRAMSEARSQIHGRQAAQDRTSGRTLLVIGAGPAGLACAMAAARLGRNPSCWWTRIRSPAEPMGDDVPQHVRRPGERGGAQPARHARRHDRQRPSGDRGGVRGRRRCTARHRLLGGLRTRTRRVSWLPGPVAAADGAMRGSSMIGGATHRRGGGAARHGSGLCRAGSSPGVVGIDRRAAPAAGLGALDVQTKSCCSARSDGGRCRPRFGTLRAAGVGRSSRWSSRRRNRSGPADHRRGSSTAGGTTLLCGACGATGGGRRGASPRRSIVADRCRETCCRRGDQRLDCDTILLGIGCVPVIELLDAAGCRVGFDRPCAGAWSRRSGRRRADQRRRDFRRSAIAPASGRRNRAIPRSPGRKASLRAAIPARQSTATAPASAPSYDLADLPDRLGAGQRDRRRAGEPHVCQCEEVTAREILEVRPPRYLGAGRRPPQRPRPWPAMLGARAAQPRSGQAPHPRRHGAVPGPPLPGAGGGAAGARRRRSARGPGPARHPSRAGAADPAAPSPPPCEEPMATWRRTVGHLVRHALPVSGRTGDAIVPYTAAAARDAADEVASE